MVKISVVGARSDGQVHGLSALFGVEGGSIGRAKTNQLILEDIERTVSRVHAQIISRDGSFLIVDRGSNPLLHNGNALGSGNEARLSTGDRLQIGGFELAVVLEVGAGMAAPSHVKLPGDMTMLSTGHRQATITDDDPFADLLAGLSPAVPTISTPAIKALNQELPVGLPDPFGADVGVRTSSSAENDPFGDLLNSGAHVASNANSVKPGSFNGIHDAKSGSIDDLFGLGAPNSAHDLFGNSPLGAPMSQPNTASAIDPLLALQSAPVVSVQARSDHIPALQQAFSGPKEAISPVVLQQEAQSSIAKTTVVNNSAAFSGSTIAPAAASDQELLAAFLRGVKAGNNMPTQVTPQLMELLGSLLHTATDGTLQLLMSRQEFKRGFRAEMTMIISEANNPLKFSPSTEIALAHLLGPKSKGFMNPEEAMSNAFADLRAHQFGVMVGMKAALAHVIQQFSPENLEAKLTEKSKLDAIFSNSRKAKLWEHFCKLYSGIATEAEDDFHTLFGKAFSKAYDEQMGRFKSGE